MKVTKEQLSERYKGKSTQELMALSVSGLTTMAKQVLEQELLDRGVTENDRKHLDRVFTQASNQAAASYAKLASLEKRLLARLIDLIVIASLIFLAEFMPQLGIMLIFIYAFLSDGIMNGQSIGKRIMRIKVVIEASGNACGLWRSFIRNLLLYALGLLDFVFVFDRHRKRLGDRMAATIVINCPPK